MAAQPTTIAVDDPHAHGHGDDHPPHLKHYFVSSEQQFDAAKLGMWLFLVTEILLFGGMFVAYGIYRAMYPELFVEASTQLDTVMGGVNTLVLLGSSLTVAWAIRAIQMDNKKLCMWLLMATVALASAFMVIKYFEYTHKFDLGIYPGANFVYAPGTEFTLEGLETGARLAPEIDHPAGAAHGVAPVPGVDQPGAVDQAVYEVHGLGEHGLYNQRAGLFFSIYYVMTGIHGLHVLIGMIAISILAWKTWKGKYSSAWYTPIENTGLYWHVVDVIWIFLFPLMYLIS
jgi:cytochrome c oxidase subunit 3